MLAGESMIQDQRADRGESVKPRLDFQQASEPYVGRWHHLVSVTNWEKGRIVCEWREALIRTGASASDYSDEAWSRRVGSVSCQHVGRLRRVYQRFGDVYEDYRGLYWSHFHAAVDWHDAELWLEGAVQNGWSVAQMRGQRWQALGAPAELKPRDEDIITADLDEDVNPAWDADPRTVLAQLADVREVVPVGQPASPEAEIGSCAESCRADVVPSEACDELGTAVDGAVRNRPFAHLAPLPDDLAEAREAFKVAILAHRLDGWRQVARDDVLRTLDALKQLAQAPADE